MGALNIHQLLFLNSAEVGDMFSIELAPIQPLDDTITQFSDYLVDTYISEDSMFPPYMDRKKFKHSAHNQCVRIFP